MNATEEPEAQLRIGELARCTGVTSRAIRHYHATGLLPEPPRDASGYRRYGSGDLVRLMHICRLRALGMPIDQISRVLAESPGAGGSLPSALLSLAGDVDAEIDRLRAVHERLITLAASDDLDDAALLASGMRERGLLELGREDVRAAQSSHSRKRPVANHAPALVAVPTVSDDRAGDERLAELLNRFRGVTVDEAEALAAELARAMPGPRHPSQQVDLPLISRLLGDRLNPAQLQCMVRLRALLEARVAPSRQAAVRAGVHG